MFRPYMLSVHVKGLLADYLLTTCPLPLWHLPCTAAVDLSVGQNSLLELKVAGIKHLKHSEFVRLVGHSPSSNEERWTDHQLSQCINKHSWALAHYLNAENCLIPKRLYSALNSVCNRQTWIGAFFLKGQFVILSSSETHSENTFMLL